MFWHTKLLRFFKVEAGLYPRTNITWLWWFMVPPGGNAVCTWKEPVFCSSWATCSISDHKIDSADGVAQVFWILLIACLLVLLNTVFLLTRNSLEWSWTHIVAQGTLSAPRLPATLVWPCFWVGADLPECLLALQFHVFTSHRNLASFSVHSCCCPGVPPAFQSGGGRQVRVCFHPPHPIFMFSIYIE